MTYGNYPDLKLVRKVLVIKMRHHGDVLLTSPVFSNLKNVLPDAEVDAFIYQDTLPMLEGHPDISKFHLYDRGWKKLGFFGKLRKEISLLMQIRKERYDLVVNLTEGDRGAIVALVSGSRYKVGFDPQGKGLKGKKKIYTHVVKNCHTPRHTVEKQLDALRKIGIFPKPAQRGLTFVIADETMAKMRHLLQEEEIAEGEYILIHPVSRWRFKCPPVSFISELIEELSKRGKQIVLSAGPDEQEIKMIEEILAKIPHIPVLNMAGKMTLKELGALLKLSRSLICVDSVPLHMASALKTPVVALFGPSSDQNWGPWMHPQGRVVAQKLSCRPCHMDGCGGSKMSDCLYTLSVKNVIEIVFEQPSCQTLPIFS